MLLPIFYSLFSVKTVFTFQFSTDPVPLHGQFLQDVRAATTFATNQNQLLLVSVSIFYIIFSLFTLKTFCLFDIDMTLHCVLTQFNCHKTPLFVFFEQPRYHLDKRRYSDAWRAPLENGPKHLATAFSNGTVCKGFQKMLWKFFLKSIKSQKCTKVPGELHKGPGTLPNLTSK